MRRAFAEARIGIAAVDVAEVHDCFTINQLLCTEALGLSADGRAGNDYLEGRFTREDGAVLREPLRWSQGQGPSRGRHGRVDARPPVQAAGGRAHRRGPGKKKPAVGVSFNVGGSAVTNCVTVLRRAR